MVIRTQVEIDEDGAEAGRSSTWNMGPDSLRQCNACFIAHNCPSYEPGASCAFSIPVEIRTKDQYVRLMDSVIEMQTQRVLFSRFAEETEGGGLDPALSAEEDRLFNLIAKRKDILDDREVFRMEMEAKGNSGMLSRVFGAQVGAATRQLQSPIDPDRVLDVIDRP